MTQVEEQLPAFSSGGVQAWEMIVDEGQPFYIESTDLPAYAQVFPERNGTRHRPHASLSEHIFQLTRPSPSNHPWLKLIVRSRAPTSSQLPVFFGGDILTGKVVLNLEKPESIKSVIVFAEGILSHPGCDPQRFISQSQTLFDKISIDSGISTSTSGAKRDKIEGRYEWEYSIALPKETAITLKQMKDLGMKMKSIEHLPPNVDSKDYQAIINYRLMVMVKRNGAFRPSSSLETLFGYIPLSRPEAPSNLRQLSYRERQPLLSPEIDPLGWECFRGLQVYGKIFTVRDIRVICTLALAKPLSYTRGTVVPLMLTVEGMDAQAIDLLGRPNSPRLSLHREYKTPLDAFFNDVSLTGRTQEKGTRSFVRWSVTNSNVEQVNERTHTRTLYGELFLPPDLTPSFTFGELDLKYYVEMYPFVAPGFASSSQGCIFRTEIVITPLYAEGPRPLSYFPPEYNASPNSNN